MKTEIITSTSNRQVKSLTQLMKKAKLRREQGVFVTEGLRIFREIPKPLIREVYVTDRFLSAHGSELGDLAYTLLSEEVFSKVADTKTPQGILCRVRIPDTPLTAPKGKCLLLDGVADPGNLGTILRTANAAGYTEAYLTKECADPFSPKSVRASMSGVFFTKIYRAERAEILSVLKDTPILIADMGGANVFTYAPPKQFALVIGNEANGVSDEVKKAAFHTIKIPMQDTQESLNAAISAGIIMYVLQKDVFSEEK
jgi:TrmH family RNA methyltransferase